MFQSQMVQSFFLSSPSFFKHFLITYSALSNHQLLHTNREKPSNNYPAAFTSPSAPHSHNFGCFHFSTVLILFAFCICSSVNLHISNLTITFSHAAFWSLSSCSFSRTPYLHPFSFSYYGLNQCPFSLLPPLPTHSPSTHLLCQSVRVCEEQCKNTVLDLYRLSVTTPTKRIKKG